MMDKMDKKIYLLKIPQGAFPSLNLNSDWAKCMLAGFKKKPIILQIANLPTVG